MVIGLWYVPSRIVTISLILCPVIRTHWIFCENTSAVSLMVIPGAILTQPVFAKIGAAGGCVLGNAITAVGIVLCLFIASLDPTTGTYATFITCLYLVYPLTVISQLSTGPMLDMLSPPDKRGFAQGINMTVRDCLIFVVVVGFRGTCNLGRRRSTHIPCLSLAGHELCICRQVCSHQYAL